MSQRIGSLAPAVTTDDYGDNTLGIEPTTSRIIYTVANNPCFVQYAIGQGNQIVWEEADRLVLPCFACVVTNAFGIRFRTALDYSQVPPVDLATALIIAELYTPADPQVEPSNLFPPIPPDAVLFEPVPPSTFQVRVGKAILIDALARAALYTAIAGGMCSQIDLLPGSVKIETDWAGGGAYFEADGNTQRARIGCGNQPLRLDSAKTSGGTPTHASYLEVELAGATYKIDLLQ